MVGILLQNTSTLAVSFGLCLFFFFIRKSFETKPGEGGGGGGGGGGFYLLNKICFEDDTVSLMKQSQTNKTEMVLGLGLKGSKLK